MTPQMGPADASGKQTVPPGESWRSTGALEGRSDGVTSDGKSLDCARCGPNVVDADGSYVHCALC